MSRWQRRVDDLLYEGESVRENVDIGSTRVVVTSHRVLTFTPEMDGENFRQADRPNVTGVDSSARSPANLLRRGLIAGVVGVVLVLAGLLFDPESLFGDDLELDTATASDVGLGSLMEITQSMFVLLMNLDTVLRNFGALALVLSAMLLGVYWYLRTPTLVIRLAGDEEEIHIPRPENADSVADRLERAILPDPRKPRDTESDDTAGENREGFVDDPPGGAETSSEPP